jgi:hypothetical protein
MHVEVCTACAATRTFESLFAELMTLPHAPYNADEGELEHKGHTYRWRIRTRSRNGEESLVLTVEKL